MFFQLKNKMTVRSLTPVVEAAASSTKLVHLRQTGLKNDWFQRQLGLESVPVPPLGWNSRLCFRVLVLIPPTDPASKAAVATSVFISDT